MKGLFSILMILASFQVRASYVLDCEVEAILQEINSSKSYKKEYFEEYDLGEVVELKIISATNDRMESLKKSCIEKLKGKTEIGKLRAPLPKGIKKGDLIKLRYVFSIPRSVNPKTRISWEIKTE